MATGSSYAWQSVDVYRGPTLVKRRTIVKCNWSDNFGVLSEKFGSEFDPDIHIFLFHAYLLTLLF